MINIQKWDDGGELWTFNKLRHRIGGPAYIGNRILNDPDNITKFSWWRHGKRHRLNAPAVIFKDGDLYYFEFNELTVIGDLVKSYDRLPYLNRLII